MTTFKIALAACLLLPLSSPCPAQDAQPFDARLDLLRNDKLVGEMTVRLESDTDGWTMTSETRGLKGMARLLGLHEHSVGNGDWLESAPRPLRYERTVDVIRTLRWTAEFDWSRKLVHTVYPDGESTLELPPRAVDEAALGLVIRLGLARGETEWRLLLVDEDEIENAHFRTRSVESLQTALGCVTAHVVEKVRREGSRRFTRTWYSAEHGFVPIRIEHGKRGGDRVEARIVSLVMADGPVRPGPDCDP